MARTARIVAFVWHQRSSAIETRERLMDGLTSGSDRVVLATCLRVEVYAAAEALEPSRMLADIGLRAVESEMLEGVAAITHLFAVAAGLDSTVVGEPQILSQVRGAAATTRHPLLVAALSRALYVGRAVRAQCGVSSTRSIGSLAVDALLSQVSRPGSARILVIGAGEMGKLALRALARRVDTVVVANRDPARAAALAEAHGARAIGLDGVGAVLAEVDAVLSAADTRGAVLTTTILEARLRRGPLPVVDIAVPRSVGPEARALLGAAYRSVDDLPGSRGKLPDYVLAIAYARCELEAQRFLASRSPERVAAIRALRQGAEAVRAAKLDRAMRRLGHLTDRDRRVVEALSANLTNALLHEPIVALRERGVTTETGSR